jgi:hypothetical protein
MKHKPRTMLFVTSLVIVLTLAMSNLPTIAYQGAGGVGKVSVHDISIMMIAGNDVRNLPAGENRIIQKAGGGNSSAQVPRGQVVFQINNGQNKTSVDLIKTGTGTLALPTSSSGLNKHGPGTLKNTPSEGSSAKLGQGTLVLTNDNNLVYELRNLSAAEFEHVLVPVTESVSMNFTKIMFFVGQSRPAAAMKPWPPQRLLLGSAKGIAQVEGWRSTGAGTAKYVCSSTACSCSGTNDCLGLADSGACASQMNCTGSGNDVKCYCGK